MRNRFVLAAVVLSTCLTIFRSADAEAPFVDEGRSFLEDTILISLERERFFDSYKLDFENDQAYQFDGDTYTIVSHVDDGWDRKRVSFDGSRRLLDYSKKNAITTFGFISKYGGGEQVFLRSDVNFIVASDAGSHNFRFPNGRMFLLAGGNVSLCLCEVMRDLIHGTKDVQHEVTFVLVTDAVYDAMIYWPSHINGEPSPDGGQFSLEQMNATKDDRFIVKYLEDKVLGTYGIFCPGQNFFRHETVDPRKMTFEIYRGTRKVKTVGKEGRVIRIVLSTSGQLDATIKRIQSTFIPGIAR